MKNTLGILIIIFLVLLVKSPSGFSQVSIEDYQRADSVMKFNNLVYHGAITPNWIDSSHCFWYKVKTRKGQEYFMIDAQKLKKNPAFDQEKLCREINRLTGKQYKPYSLPISNISFSKNLKELHFELDSFKWKCNLAGYKTEKGARLEKASKQRYWGESIDELGNSPVTSPDSQWVAYVKNFNVYIKGLKTSEEFQLSFDGSEGEFYSSYFEWSPDSKYVAVNKVRDNKKRYVHFVESSPKDQLQPILQKIEYLKPGDALPVKMPSLFSIAEKKQIHFSTDEFKNQYHLSNPQWWKDSRGFTFEFNQRGHQAYQVVEVEAPTGSLKTIIDEQSSTFIDYSSKRYRYDVNDGEEIIWTSERDGWNHLYLFNGKTGMLNNQITKSEWVVRGVVKVFEKERQVIFKASGKNPGEDPYFIHYYRINFDGSGLTDLTPEPFNHDISFSDDYQYFVDCYSSVEEPPVSVLRAASDGRVLMQVENADISELLATGWKAPEVFHTKGRDGKTEIRGNVYRPSNFDPENQYPVIEYIYAGPHSSFVQKNFYPVPWFAGVAELGFVVVQVDGMGTSNRSKAFHDVCWKNLKDGGFPDRIIWIKALAEKYPYLDTTKVGIFGVSAGGQNAMSALLFHPGFYKVSVSSCGCHDNRMDKIWWNEQFMGYPIGPHYEACSNVVNANRLQGKLLLMVGEVDDNVDPSSTMQVVNALIKADKDFELLVLPGEKHTAGGKYGERRRRDFFVRHLLNSDPPDWNKITENEKL
ncbi:MAG: DPP IV N-terminal domain-containing protein [Bacteroidales bacterium]|nr:DPP IV N-terminal domain-containing protein [Bacteroidales bacterium]